MANVAADAVFSIAAPFTRPSQTGCPYNAEGEDMPGMCVRYTSNAGSAIRTGGNASVALPVQGHKDKAADSPGLY